MAICTRVVSILMAEVVSIVTATLATAAAAAFPACWLMCLIIQEAEEAGVQVSIIRAL